MCKSLLRWSARLEKLHKSVHLPFTSAHSYIKLNAPSDSNLFPITAKGSWSMEEAVNVTLRVKMMSWTDSELKLWSLQDLTGR